MNLPLYQSISRAHCNDHYIWENFAESVVDPVRTKTFLVKVIGNVFARSAKKDPKEEIALTEIKNELLHYSNYSVSFKSVIVNKSPSIYI